MKSIIQVDFKKESVSFYGEFVRAYVVRYRSTGNYYFNRFGAVKKLNEARIFPTRKKANEKIVLRKIRNARIKPILMTLDSNS